MSEKEIVFKVAESDLKRIRASGQVEFKFDNPNAGQTELINCLNDLMEVLIKHEAYLVLEGKK